MPEGQRPRGKSIRMDFGGKEWYSFRNGTVYCHGVLVTIRREGWKRERSSRGGHKTEVFRRFGLLRRSRNWNLQQDWEWFEYRGKGITRISFIPSY